MICSTRNDVEIRIEALLELKVMENLTHRAELTSENEKLNNFWVSKLLREVRQNAKLMIDQLFFEFLTAKRVENSSDSLFISIYYADLFLKKFVLI